ncbi:MAG TPA: DUF6660 family protein [Chitinophagaceae bacterium]
MPEPTMKVLAFILSAYLLLLFAVPCCSFDDCPEDKTVQTTGHENEDGPALPAGTDCGSCSPFFTCTGCASVIVSFEYNNIEIAPIFISHQYTGFVLSSIPDAHYDFWQPPKLVS